MADATILCAEKAIGLYEDFTKGEDYARFNQNKAVAFKGWLLKRTHDGKTISIATVHGHLRQLKAFFVWLSDQQGYKSRISLDSISYLSLDKKKVREATAARRVKFPTLDYVEALVGSIVIETDIDLRDRALIAFLLLSGMRVRAIASLPLGCFDRQTLQVEQNPAKGVETKFGKSFVSVLFPFSERLVKIVVEWVEYLEREMLFSPTDPLFPKSKVEQEDGGLMFVATQIDRDFWSGTGPIREILISRSKAAGMDYFHPHTFRHAADYLAIKRCRNAEELKAVSQNFGHEHVSTTLMTYGKLDQIRVIDVVDGIDFSAKEGSDSGNIPAAELEALMKKYRKGT